MIDKDNIVSAKYMYDSMSNPKQKYAIVVDDETHKYSVPLDSRNRDYQVIMQWVDDGNTIIDNP